MSQSIPLSTILGERYKVTASIVETADGDSILEGKDQVLTRKVSIVVAAPEHNERLISNARTLATGARSSIQILDLGNAQGRTYLITSHSRADVLLDHLLADAKELKANSEKEALGEEIFGDTGGMATSKPYEKVEEEPPLPVAISATRALDQERIEDSVSEPAVADDDYGYEDEYEDEEERRGGSPWIVAIAAVILLVIGAAAIYSSLNGMVNSEQASGSSSDSSTSARASATDSASQTAEASASPTEKKVDPRFTSVSRISPSNPTFMAAQDAMLAQTIDGNENTQWLSLAFGSANFGGLADSFALSYELAEETKVPEITINQVSGTGGSFTVLTNTTNSLDGAVEVGSGSFTAPAVTVQLDTGKQSADTKYVLIRFNSAPQLSQPIVAGYVYGLRIAEVSASN